MRLNLRLFKYLYFFQMITLIFSLKIFANPQDSSIISGDVIIEQFEKDTLNILASDKAIINWKSFSLESNEITRFIQPGSDACVLNRVIGHDLSNILGRIEANGQVFLINPNGILISENAFINTSSFLASTLDVSDEDFLNAKDLIFKGFSKEAIINYGTIQTLDGNITLLGNIVENHGSIYATKGKVTIAASDEILLQMDDDHLGVIRLKNDNSSDAKIYNSGSISAIQADLISGGNPYDYAIKNSGSISAFGLEEKDGHVFLIAQEGTNYIDGSIIAKNSDDQGGEVHLLGKKVGLFDNATIDVSAKNGGGTVLVGGDYQGSNPDIFNSDFTYVNENASIYANSYDEGDGGKIIFWSDGFTQFYGFADVSAGVNSGDGGLIEVSGKKNFDFIGTTNRSAPNGKAGTLLLDPESDITIITGGAAPVGGAFAGGVFTPTATPSTISIGGGAGTLITELAAGPVIVQTTGPTVPGGGDGTITFAGNMFYSSSNSFTLQANGQNVSGESIIFNARLRNSGTGAIYIKSTTGGLSITPITASAIIETVNTTGGIIDIDVEGDIILQGGTTTARTAEILGGNDVIIKTNGNLEILGGTNPAGAGRARIRPGQTAGPKNITINVGNNMRVIGGDPSGTADIVPVAGNIDLTVDGDLTITGGAGAPCEASIRAPNNGRTLDAVVGGNISITGGATASTQARMEAFGTTSVSAGGNITLISDGSPAKIAAVGTNTLNVTAGGNISLTGTGGAGNDATILASILTITANGSFFLNSDSVMGATNGALMLFAGRDLIMRGDARLIGFRADATIVVDNLFPTSPGIGTGSIQTEVGTSIESGFLPPIPLEPLRIFTASQSLNSINGNINGAAFVPGTLYVDTTQEQWSTYYPSTFGGSPFTVFYKDFFVPPTPEPPPFVIPGIVKDTMFAADAEMQSRYLHPFDEYIKRYLIINITSQEKVDENSAKIVSIPQEKGAKKTYHYFIRQKENPTSTMQLSESL